MSRLSSLLRLFVEGRYVEPLDGRPDKLRVQVIADMQARYDHLAGVPRSP
jgi:hypothetical protein